MPPWTARTTPFSSCDQIPALARYDTNGTLDPSFGSSGTVVTTIGSDGDVAYALALASDGKIVVGSRKGVGSLFFTEPAPGLSRGRPPMELEAGEREWVMA